MRISIIVTFSALTLAAAGQVPCASADTANANCQVRKHGDLAKDASGPCTFSQRQGYVDITLHNGGQYSLSPGKRANHFKDQNGHGVERTAAEGSTQTYKWNHMQIVVDFGAPAAGGSGQGASYKAGETAPDLADLVGAKAGQAEGTLQARGYEYSRGSTSGNTKYGSWYKRATGQCVMIRTEEGRFASIVQAPPSDCGH